MQTGLVLHGTTQLGKVKERDSERGGRRRRKRMKISYFRALLGTEGKRETSCFLSGSYGDILSSGQDIWVPLIHQVLFPLCLLSVLGVPFVHMSVYLCLFLFCCLNDCCSVFHVEKKWLKLHLLAVHPLIQFNLFKRQSQFAQQKLRSYTALWLGVKYKYK